MTDTPRNGVLVTAQRLLEQHVLCDRCLGRQFGWLSTNTSNDARGHSLKLTLSMIADEQLKSGSKELGTDLIRFLANNGMFDPAKTIAQRNGIIFESRNSCYLCSIEEESVFERIPLVAERIVGLAKDIEFDTFLVGSNPVPSLVERQDELSGIHSILHAETLKSHFNRELGMVLYDLLQKTVDFDKPDVVFVYSMITDELKLQVNPIFIYGRYRKLTRGIPQSKWDCKKCKGRGCAECNETGRKYPDSISEYVGVPAQIVADGPRFKFHAAGREDIDVLMLGQGRPFVVEITEPRVRTPDLDEITKSINTEAEGKIEVHDLVLTDRHHLQKLKEDASINVKEYEALIAIDNPVTDAELKMVENEFKGIKIGQRTPHRVSHRRSDLVREKIIHEISLEQHKDGLLKATFKVQGGTYIKELISGDEGRTTPSIAEKLGTACKCAELNVTAIYSSGS
ncbi:tRNA pseudouridine(54/55) synthase Pus10 [Candidatus Thorarchaeota archaeon]|nr:tRNA pseudouridine(54/55) synthase Pus10 [Candidatus Thorarchaeota archaeon]TFG96172.1 MAG: tRNA pseudouridine(54/55) synthase Pus10 [Candidatus Thorarchaeota archaeon]